MRQLFCSAWNRLVQQSEPKRLCNGSLTMHRKLKPLEFTSPGEVMRQKMIASESAQLPSAFAGIFILLTINSWPKINKRLLVRNVNAKSFRSYLEGRKRLDSIGFRGGRGSISTRGDPAAPANIHMKSTHLIDLRNARNVAATPSNLTFAASDATKRLKITKRFTRPRKNVNKLAVQPDKTSTHLPQLQRSRQRPWKHLGSTHAHTKKGLLKN